MTKHKKSFKKKVVAPSVSHKHQVNDTSWRNMSNWFVVLVLVLPILFSNKTIEPNIVVRYIFLSLFLLLFILFFFITGKMKNIISFPPLIKLLFGLSIAYCLWSSISMFSAINATPAYYEIGRQFLNIILLFLIIVTVGKEPELVLKLCKGIIVLSIIESFIGILQFYQVAFMDLPGNKPNVPYGLMGHRNLFGSAQSFLLPFVLFVLHKEKRAWVFISTIAVIGIITSVFNSQTRSAWLSTITILIVVLVLVIILNQFNKKRVVLNVLSGTGGIILLVSLLYYVNKKTEFSRPVKDRTSIFIKPEAGINEISSGRIEFWDKSLKLIKDHYMLGVGPGNWQLAIPPYGNDVNLWNEGLIIPDRPHNVYLEVMSETGIPGAVLYFSTWILVIISGLVVLLRSTSDDIRVFTILMLAGLGGFFIDSFFSFPTSRIEHSLYFIIMCGIVLGFYANLPGKKKLLMNSINKWLMISVFIIMFNIFIGFIKYNFEVHARLAKAYRTENRNEEVIEEVEAGRSALVTIDINGEPLQLQSGAAYVKLNDFPKALKEISIARRYHPNSARIYTTMGVIYSNMQQYDNAIDCYVHALSLTPRYKLALQNLAGVYYISGNYTACLQTLAKLDIKNNPYLTKLQIESEKQFRK